MTMRPSPTPPASTARPPDPTDDPAADQSVLNRRAQLLSSEHWSLLATRSMSWNEAFSRTSMFLSMLSAGTVALALAASVMSFGGAFVLFALIVLSVVLFMGVATYVRLVQVNNEDLLWVVGMNRVRGAYTRLSPGIEEDFITGWTIDARGVSRTFGASDVTEASPLHAVVTTPAVVAVIASVIAGVIGGLLVLQVGASMELSIGLGAGLFVLACGSMLAYGVREYNRFVARLERQYGVRSSDPTSST